MVNESAVVVFVDERAVANAGVMLYYNQSGVTQHFTGGAAGCPAYLTSQADRYSNTITYSYNSTGGSAARLGDA